MVAEKFSVDARGLMQKVCRSLSSAIAWLYGVALHKVNTDQY